MNSLTAINIDELNPYVRKAGKQNSPSWRNKSRRIYDHEFLYCFKGKAHITIEDRNYDLSPGTLILIKPDRPHSLWMEDETQPEIIWVHFDYIFRNDVYNLNRLVTDTHSVLFEGTLPQKTLIRLEPVLDNWFVFPEFFQLQMQNFPQSDFIGDTFRKILSAFEKNHVFWQLECKILLLQLLKELLQLFPESATRPQCLPDNPLTRTLVKYLSDYVEANYHRKVSIGELARIIGLNEDYLGKLIKKETGESFSGYVCRARLKKAKELLSRTDLSISNIAEMTGFNDVYYFCRVMKKYEGLSPLKWRNAIYPAPD